MRIIPQLLIDYNKLFKGKKFQNRNYVGCPLNTVRIFCEKKADEIIITDFNAHKKNINYDYLSKIRNIANVPLLYGGGIRNFEQVKKIFDLGYERIILNSIFFQNPKILDEVVKVYGEQSILINFDIKKIKNDFKIYTNNGRRQINRKLDDFLLFINSNYKNIEIIINFFENEGSYKIQNKIDIEKLCTFENLSFIYSGRVEEKDIGSKWPQNINALIVGSLFLFNRKTDQVLIKYKK